MTSRFTLISGDDLVSKLSTCSLMWQEPPLRSSQITVLVDADERRLLGTTFRCADALSEHSPVIMVTDDRAELDIRYRTHHHKQRGRFSVFSENSVPVVPTLDDTLAWHWIVAQVSPGGLLIIEVPTLGSDPHDLLTLLRTLRRATDGNLAAILIAVRDDHNTIQQDIRPMLRATDVLVQQN